MRDICLISRDAGHLMKMRDCPAECGTVATYAMPPRSDTYVPLREIQELAILGRGRATDD